MNMPPMEDLPSFKDQIADTYTTSYVSTYTMPFTTNPQVRVFTCAVCIPYCLVFRA